MLDQLVRRRSLLRATSTVSPVLGALKVSNFCGSATIVVQSVVVGDGCCHQFINAHAINAEHI
jgi:hypothetical protein